MTYTIITKINLHINTNKKYTHPYKLNIKPVCAASLKKTHGLITRHLFGGKVSYLIRVMKKISLFHKGLKLIKRIKFHFLYYEANLSLFL